MLAKLKQLSVVLTTRDSPKQRVSRAELMQMNFAEATAYDYATAAEYNSPS